MNEKKNQEVKALYFGSVNKMIFQFLTLVKVDTFQNAKVTSKKSLVVAQFIKKNRKCKLWGLLLMIKFLVLFKDELNLLVSFKDYHKAESIKKILVGHLFSTEKAG